MARLLPPPGNDFRVFRFRDRFAASAASLDTPYDLSSGTITLATRDFNIGSVPASAVAHSGRVLMKKVAIFLICFFPAALLFLIFTFRFKPDGGFYFTFLAHAPVIIAGDGSSYQSAYQLRHGRASDLKNTELERIRDQYRAGPGRTYVNFSTNFVFASTNLNGRVYDVVTFTLSNKATTDYFDVTSYKSRP